MVADGAEEEKAAGEKAEEGAEFKTYKEVEINNLIETMKNNYAATNQESQYNLANHYQSIDATHEQFHGRKPDRYDLVAKQTKGEITAKSLVADENVINQPLVSQLGNTVPPQAGLAVPVSIPYRIIFPQNPPQNPPPESTQNPSQNQHQIHTQIHTESTPEENMNPLQNPTRIHSRRSPLGRQATLL